MAKRKRKLTRIFKLAQQCFARYFSRAVHFVFFAKICARKYDHILFNILRLSILETINPKIAIAEASSIFHLSSGFFKIIERWRHLRLFSMLTFLLVVLDPECGKYVLGILEMIQTNEVICDTSYDTIFELDLSSVNTKFDILTEEVLQIQDWEKIISKIAFRRRNLMFVPLLSAKSKDRCDFNSLELV